MTKKSRRLEEAARLHAWCLEFLRAVYSMAPKAVDVPLAAYQHGIDVALKRGDVKGLRMAARDCLEWASESSEEQRVRIDRDIRSRLGVGLSDQERDWESALAAFVARGAIADDDECRLVEARVIEIANDPDGREELETLNDLLAAYSGVLRRRG